LKSNCRDDIRRKGRHRDSLLVCLAVRHDRFDVHSDRVRLNQSRAHRILWLLEELNIPYELKTFKRGPDKLAPKALKDIHPLGKSPIVAISLPNAESPLVLAESAFIADYLCDHFGGAHLVPQRFADANKDGQVGGETEEWLRYRYYMHYTEGSLMPNLVMKVVMNSKFLWESSSWS
jgi:glutathione S-transferase